MTRGLLVLHLALAWLAILPGAVRLTARAGKPAKQTVDKSLPLRVVNPRKLGVWELPAERISLGEEYPVSPYKPTLALLPSGELVMIAFHSQDLPQNRVHEWNSL